MEVGQAAVQPQAPLNPMDYVAAALEREEPEFEKAQERANNPSLEDEKPPEKAEEQKAEPEKEAEKQEVQEQEQEEEISLDLDAPIIETTYKVEGGEDKVEKLSIKELQKGYMRQQDYQRKTAEIAKERGKSSTEAETKVKQAQEQYEKNLSVMRQAVMAAIAPELQGVNLMQLAQEDPAAYVQKQARLQQVGQLLQSIDAEMSKAQKAKEIETSQSRAKAVQEAVETLKRDIPGWGKQKYDELMEFGVEVGYSPQEIAEVTDPRVFKLLDVAKKYNALQKAKPEVEKKLVKVPKVLKPGTADKNDKADRASEKWDRLNKERSPEAAASLIYDMI